MTCIVNDDGSQITATPANVFWGDSVLLFCDPTSQGIATAGQPVITGISGQWDGALHTCFVNYDDDGNFVDLDRQPSLDLATGQLIDHDEDEDDGVGDEENAVNGDDATVSSPPPPLPNGAESL